MEHEFQADLSASAGGTARRTKQIDLKGGKRRAEFNQHVRRRGGGLPVLVAW
jgi:hypothetical protein